MSNRILIILLLALCAGTAAAEAGKPGTTTTHPTFKLGATEWLVYRPPGRVTQIHDFDYMMDRLRSNQAGLGLRFSPDEHFRLDLTLAPLIDRNDFVGPVYDMDVGATRLTLTFSF